MTGTVTQPRPSHRRLLAALTLAAGLVALPAAADTYTVVPDVFVYCTTCHGVELKGNRSVDAPRLNGMEGWYVRAQLEAFKRGWRGTHPQDVTGMEMQPQAAMLDAEQIDDAVAFVTAIPQRADEQVTVKGDVDRGKSLYTTCAACHGAQAEGNRALNAPALAHQSDWYLARQLQRYKAGIRGSDAADVAGTQMRVSTNLLPDEASIDDVVSYIKSLR